MDNRYEIRILGYLGPLLRAALDCLRAVPVPRQTTIRGRLSPTDLSRLLRLLDEHGITLVHLERAGRRSGYGSSWDDASDSAAPAGSHAVPAPGAVRRMR